MPIDSIRPTRCLDEFAFEAIDYRVMGHAYASQNELGRLCDESVYEADLAARLRSDGFKTIVRQTPINITHQDYAKRYYVDLLVDGALYEWKADTALVPDHDAQILNYMLLLGIKRGKLLNFRSGKVQGKIVASSLTSEQRHQFTFITKDWDELTPACRRLREVTYELLQDWGAFLEVALYQEALVHFLGGESLVHQPVRLNRNGIPLGVQKMFVHAPRITFWVTAFTDQQSFAESHLRRLLALADLKAIHWINFNHATIEFTTVHATS